MAIEHLLVSDHTGEEMYQVNVYLHRLCYRFHRVSMECLSIENLYSAPPCRHKIESRGYTRVYPKVSELNR
jgi:hypothetical protein